MSANKYIGDSVHKISNLEMLESKIQKKQQKRLKNFEKDQDKQIEEAKRSGSIIEDYSREARGGMNEPLLPNRDDPERQINQDLQQINQNILQERRVFL